MRRYCFPILASLLVILSGISQAEIYKHTNPDGSVEFADVPKSKDAKPVELPPLPTFIPPSSSPTPLLSQPDSATKQAVRYTSVTITSPTDDTAIRNNAGNIRINVTTEPPLQPGHRLVLLMDSKPQAEGKSGRFHLTNLDRGTHTLQAQIFGPKDTPLLESKSVVFHLLRVSVR
jgi:hypothetical protein